MEMMLELLIVTSSIPMWMLKEAIFISLTLALRCCFYLFTFFRLVWLHARLWMCVFAEKTCFLLHKSIEQCVCECVCVCDHNKRSMYCGIHLRLVSFHSVFVYAVYCMYSLVKSFYFIRFYSLHESNADQIRLGFICVGYVQCATLNIQTKFCCFIMGIFHFVSF